MNKSDRFLPLKEKDTLTYSDIKEMVEYLISCNAYKWNVEGMSTEDIAQEMRLECLKILPKWDRTKGAGNPIWFFAKHIFCRMMNLVRDSKRKNPSYNIEEQSTKKVLPIEYFHIYGRRLNINWPEIFEEALPKMDTPGLLASFEKLVDQMSFLNIHTSYKTKIMAILQPLMDEKDLNSLRHPDVEAHKALVNNKYVEDDFHLDKYLKILENS